MDKIKALVNIFENKVANAWEYNTLITYKDDPLDINYDKADQLFVAVDIARKNLLDAIGESL